MKNKIIFTAIVIFTVLAYCISGASQVKANDINKKIGWGIKRNDNHEQPDLGKENTELIKKYNGIAMGNKESKNIYLTCFQAASQICVERAINF